MLAPMAGMSDLPYREICRLHGAGYAVGEMTASKPELRNSRKSSTRWADRNESGLRVVQLLGADPLRLADAARYAVDSGAHVVDINMGCPAKKVLQTACGSALMKDEALIERIVQTVVAAVEVPVTVKIRTGWDRDHKNAVSVAERIERAGAAMLCVHGRTRADGFSGSAEYETIRRVKQAVGIPVIANGDITSGAKALEVMRETGADGVMIGRASYGNPWIFGQVSHALGFRADSTVPELEDYRRVMLAHMTRHFEYYGPERGVITIRKHLNHYFKGFGGSREVLNEIFLSRDPDKVLGSVDQYMQELSGNSREPGESISDKVENEF